MKVFLKILLALVIVAALCGGVYLVLPETAQTYVKGYIQYRTDDNAKSKIDSLKNDNNIIYDAVQTNGTSKKVDTGVKYGTALDKAGKSVVWYYEDRTDGGFTITYYGTKVSMDLSKYGADGTYIDKTLKFVFDFPSGGGSTISIYIGDEQCDDTMKAAVLQALAGQ